MTDTATATKTRTDRARPQRGAGRSAAGELADPLEASARIAPGFDLPQIGPATRRNAHQHGLTQREFGALQGVSRSERLDLSVRTGHSSRTRHVGEEGSRPKPAGLYEKTSKTDRHPGLVLPPLDGACSDGRFSAQPGSPLMDTAGNHVHGDIDLKSVARDGKVLPPTEYVPMLNGALDAGSERERPRSVGAEVSKSGLPAGMVRTGSKIQHGAHDDWDRRNDMSYDGGRNAGPIPGVLHMQPGHANQIMYTTSAYRQHLEQQGRGDTYSEAAWARGRERDASASEGIASIKKATLHPRSRSKK